MLINRKNKLKLSQSGWAEFWLEQDFFKELEWSERPADTHTLHSLPPRVRNNIKSYLAPKERNVLAAADQRLFRPGFYLTQLLSAVVRGEPDDVVSMIRANPQSLFVE